MKNREILRYFLLEDMYKSMSDEQKKDLIQLAEKSNDHREIMNALQSLGRKVDESKHSWLADFGANVAGNAAFDSAVWLLSKLIKRL